MAESVVNFGIKAGKQIVKTVREHTRRMINEQPQRGRWQQQQPSSQGCTRSYDLRLLWNPTAAALTISVRYNAVTEVIDLDGFSDETDVMTAVDAHSEFVIDDVHCTAVSAGGFPSSNILLTLPSGATIVEHTASMTSGEYSPSAEFRVDICGCVGSS